MHEAIVPPVDPFDKASTVSSAEPLRVNPEVFEGLTSDAIAIRIYSCSLDAEQMAVETIHLVSYFFFHEKQPNIKPNLFTASFAC